MSAGNSIRGQAEAIGRAFPDLMDETILANPQADSPLFHAVGLRYLTRMFAQGALRGEMEDAAYPKFIPSPSLWMSWAFGNPDAGYQYATISGNHTYRLFGRRGTARIFDVESWGGDVLDVSSFHVCSGVRHVHLDPTGAFVPGGDLDIGPDGSFEITLSTEPQPGNWVRIPEGPCGVVVREYFYDWEREDRAEFYLERVDATYPPPPLTAADLERRASRIPEFMHNNVPMLARGVELQHYALAPNAMRRQPLHAGEEVRGQDDQLGLRDVYFLQGLFECGPDDAVILEVPDIESDYWVYYLASHNWEAGDFHFRQTSLNGSQATIDPDGVFRAVIAQQDPGVPNWLDPAGAPSGLILARYFMPSGELLIPQLRVVPVASVRDALPSGTPSVSPADRSEALRRRMHSVRRRHLEI